MTCAGVGFTVFLALMCEATTSQIGAVSGADVLRVAQRVLDLERYSEAVIRP